MSGFKLGTNAVPTRPGHSEVPGGEGWAVNKSSPEANDGTEITAELMNELIAAWRGLETYFSIAYTPGGDNDQIAQGLETALTPPAAAEDVAGLIKLATHAEVTAGSDAVKAITALTLATRLAALTFGTGQISDDAVTLAKMAHGTAGLFLGYDETGAPAAVTPAGGTPDIIIEQRENSTTDGGGVTAGAYQNRILTGAAYDPSSHVVAFDAVAGTFELAPGTYFADWWGAVYRSGGEKSRLYNTTDSAVLVLGNVWSLANSVDSGGGLSNGSGYFTIAAAGKDIALQSFVETSRTDNGFGRRANAWTDDHIFAQIKLWKVA